MTDIRLICAERRVEDLLTVLAAAVRGDPHWRRDAKLLLADIDKTTYPEPLTEAERERLREIDARKRAAEITEDVRRFVIRCLARHLFCCWPRRWSYDYLGRGAHDLCSYRQTCLRCGMTLERDV